MASLVKIPYGELAPLPNSVPAFLTVNVDGVYKVIIDGTDGIKLYYGDENSAGTFMNAVLNFQGATSVVAQDIINFQNIIAEAAQAPLGIPTFELVGDDGTVNYHLAVSSPVTLAAGSPV